MTENEEALTEREWDSKINVYTSSETIVPTVRCDSNVQFKPESSSSSTDSGLIDWGSDSTWPDVDLPSSWGIHGIEEIPWKDEDRRFVRLKKYHEISLREDEFSGVLSDRIVASSSSYLNTSPETGQYVLCKYNLANKNLKDINILTYHHYVQYLNLSWNKLTDLEPLGQLPFLMYLDASHNNLQTILEFKPPFNLTYVNFSHNKVEEINDLSGFWSIVYLDLSYNCISMIEGLHNLNFMRHLNLEHNEIECVENLNCLKLMTLNLHHNDISKFEEGDTVGFKTLNDIISVNLSCNNLKTLQLFDGAYSLQFVDVSHNKLEDLIELHCLQGLNFLTEANFKGNAICETENYLEVCLCCMKSVLVMDGSFISAEQKVLARNKYNSTAQLFSAKKCIQLMLLGQLEQPLIGFPVVPADQPPPPIIVLVGPPGSQKKQIIRQFHERNKLHIKIGVSHTTRPLTGDEVDGEFYYHVTREQFQQLLHSGDVLSMNKCLGYLFALTRAELEKVTSEYGVMVLHTDLAGALTLRTQGFRPKLILAMPRTPETHKQWLKEKYYYYHWNPKTTAIKVENWPEKALSAISEAEQLSRTSVMCFARTMLDEVIRDVAPSNDEQEEHGEEKQGDEEENEDVTRNGQLNDVVGLTETLERNFEMDGESVDSKEESEPTLSKVSGILKAAPSLKGKSAVEEVEETTARTSVTFRNDSLFLKVKIPSSRSVTFAVDNDEFDDPYYSASEAALLEEQDGPVFLSALSQSRIKSLSETTVKPSLSQRIRSQRAKDAAVEVFYDEVIASRELYLEMHRTNVGLFSGTIFTDEPEKALLRLKKALQESVQKQRESEKIYEIHQDSMYRSMVAARLSSLHNDIKRDMSTSLKQIATMGKRKDKKPLKSQINKPKEEVIEKMRHVRRDSLFYELPKPSVKTKRESSLSSTNDSEGGSMYS